MTAEEMKELDAAILHWDSVEKEFLVTVKGLAGANRKRRYRLGKAILDTYFALGMAVKNPQNSLLRPYYERMKRSYMKNRKTRQKPEKHKSGTSLDDKNHRRIDRGFGVRVMIGPSVGPRCVRFYSITGGVLGAVASFYVGRFLNPAGLVGDSALIAFTHRSDDARELEFPPS